MTANSPSEMTDQQLAHETVAAIASLVQTTRQDLAAVAEAGAILMEAAQRFVRMATEPRRVVIIAPDKNSDYCYVDMTKDEALAMFQAGDDAALYDPARLKVSESEFKGGFMLWRNMGNDMADILGQRGLPPEFADLLRPPKK